MSADNADPTLLRRILSDSKIPEAEQSDGSGRPPSAPAAKEAAMLAEWLKQPPDPSFAAAPVSILATTV